MEFARGHFMSKFEIRRAVAGDIVRLSRLREELWPESSAGEHAVEIAEILAGKWRSALPRGSVRWEA